MWNEKPTADPQPMLPPTSDEEEIRCPVCNQILSPNTADRHVNLCLDQLADMESSVTPTILRSPPSKSSSTRKTTQSALNPSGSQSVLNPSITTTSKTLPNGTPKSLPLKVKPALGTNPFVAGTAELGTEPTSVSVERKPVPFYKRLPHTPFVVDAFRYGKIPGVTGYFLTHFHADHYTGLQKSFDHGPIYCSAVTGNLVEQELRVRPEFIHRLPMNEPYRVTPHITVELMCANHCPGAVLFLFTVANPSNGAVYRYLHTGDFRALPSHALDTRVQRAPVDILYLDTTYCKPQHVFPSQASVLSQTVRLCVDVVRAAAGVAGTTEDSTMEEKPSHDLRWLLQYRKLEAKRKRLTKKEQEVLHNKKTNHSILRWLQRSTFAAKEKENTTSISSTSSTVIMETATVSEEMAEKEDTTSAAVKEEPLPRHAHKQSRTLFVVGTYLIGKEKVFLAIAEALQCKIYADARKRRILRCLQMPELEERLTDDPWSTCLHVVQMNALEPSKLADYLEQYRPRYQSLLAFRPTGWTFSPSASPDSAGVTSTNTNENESVCTDVRPVSVAPNGSIALFGVPYSEHSSYAELQHFVRNIAVRRIIPTVNVGNPKSREEMEALFRQWQQPFPVGSSVVEAMDHGNKTAQEEQKEGTDSKE